MVSKYAGVVKGMERWQPEDSDGQKYQARVDEEKKRVRDQLGVVGPEALARRWRRIRAIMERFKARESKINLALNATFQLMTEAFEAAEVTKISLKEGGSVSVQPEVYVSLTIPGMFDELVAKGADVKQAKEAVREEAKRRLREWARENGHENDLTINSQTLGSIFKELLMEGHAVPDFVKFSAGAGAKLFKE